MLPLIVEDQPHSALAHFRGNLFVVLLMMLHPCVFKVGHTGNAGGTPFHPGELIPLSSKGLICAATT